MSIVAGWAFARDPLAVTAGQQGRTSRLQSALPHPKLLAVLGCFLALPCFSADAPGFLVRTRLEPASGVAIGQPATLYVDVFTDLFFTSGIDLPALNVPGAMIKLSDERPPHISDTIRGASWVGIEHQYTITPIVAADLAIPEFEVSARVGPQSQALVAKTRPLSLRVSAPPGAEGAFVTHDLALKQSTDADLGALKVGDAFTRTVELRAGGTPAMFIPDVALGDVDGLRAYSRTPLLADSAPDAPVVGRRTFAVNYVVQRPGDFQLPAIEVRWWDLDTRRASVAQLPALEIHAVAAPTAPPAFALPVEQPTTTASRRIPWHELMVAGGIAIATGIALWWLVPRLRRGWQQLRSQLLERHQRHLESEPYAFTELQSALRRGDVNVSAALYRWLDRLPRDVGASHTTVIASDASFRSASAQLLSEIYGTQHDVSAAALQAVRRSLPAARRSMLRHFDAGRTRIRRLPKINP